VITKKIKNNKSMTRVLRTKVTETKRSKMMSRKSFTRTIMTWSV